MWVFVGLAIIFALLHLIQLWLRQEQERRFEELRKDFVEIVGQVYTLSIVASNMALLVKALTDHVVAKIGPADGENTHGSN